MPQANQSAKEVQRRIDSGETAVCIEDNRDDYWWIWFPSVAPEQVANYWDGLNEGRSEVEVNALPGDVILCTSLEHKMIWLELWQGRY